MSIINSIISLAAGQANLDAGGDVGDHMAGMMGGFGFMGIGAIFWLIILILLTNTTDSSNSQCRKQASATTSTIE